MTVCQVDPIYMQRDRNWDPPGCTRRGVVFIKADGKWYCRQHAWRVWAWTPPTADALAEHIATCSDCTDEAMCVVATSMRANLAHARSKAAR